MNGRHSSDGQAGRVLRLAPRKGLWLYSYDQTKYMTPFQHFGLLVLGAGALVLGTPALWYVVTQRQQWSLFGFILMLIVPLAVVGYGLLHFPVGLIYFVRRWRGTPTDYFDYEVVDHGKAENHDEGVDHGPNDR